MLAWIPLSLCMIGRWPCTPLTTCRACPTTTCPSRTASSSPRLLASPSSSTPRPRARSGSRTRRPGANCRSVHRPPHQSDVRVTDPPRSPSMDDWLYFCCSKTECNMAVNAALQAHILIPLKVSNIFGYWVLSCCLKKTIHLSGAVKVFDALMFYEFQKSHNNSRPLWDWLFNNPAHSFSLYFLSLVYWHHKVLKPVGPRVEDYIFNAFNVFKPFTLCRSQMLLSRLFQSNIPFYCSGISADLRNPTGRPMMITPHG